MSTLIGGFYFMMSFYKQAPAVDLITNIFHRGGIFHTTETKIGAQKTFGLVVLMRSY